MNNDKNISNESIEEASKEKDDNKKNIGPKNTAQTVKNIIKVISVCIVYVLVTYFLIAAQTAFSWENTADSIYNLILILLVLLILPFILILYLRTKIKRKWLISIILVVLICVVLKSIIMFIGVPYMKKETESFCTHQFENWTTVDSSCHEMVCKKCSIEIFEGHSLAISSGPVGESYHIMKCVDCNYTVTQPHMIRWVSTGPDLHKGTCTICNYTKTESHAVSYDDLTGQCAKCGYNGPISSN